MISSKADYLNYVARDMDALGAKIRHPLIEAENSMIWLTDPIVRWLRLLRKLEYWENCKKNKLWSPPIRLWLRWRFQRKSMQLGFSIPLNVCGPGLCILHYGSVVISRHAQIGENCTLNSAVNIGANPSSPSSAPHIGNNVYIGPGAKLWNGISVADGSVIGANACVSKDVPEPNSVIIGTNKRVR